MIRKTYLKLINVDMESIQCKYNNIQARQIERDSTHLVIIIFSQTYSLQLKLV